MVEDKGLLFTSSREKHQSDEWVFVDHSKGDEDDDVPEWVG